ncbi:MAG TPA: hypothetical protein VFF06_26040 [Polyangia bacterium]|nr:hypothetical protein [Polyangia bacterium]
MRAAIVCLLFTVVSAGAARADVPRLINFQGRLASAQGTPQTGVYLISFTLYNTSAGANTPSGSQPCHTETENVPVNSGLFSVVLGASTGGINANCNFAVPYWLEIKVGADAPMSPRIALTGAAQAFVAQSLQGLPATNTALYAGNASGNVPVSNGAKNVNLNAQYLGGLDVSKYLNKPVYTCGTAGDTHLQLSCGALQANFAGYISPP